MKQEFEIPEGCKVTIEQIGNQIITTIEQIGNQIITTFEQKEKKRVGKGEDYWYMDAYFEVHDTYDLNHHADNNRFNIGNYYLSPDDPELLARIELNKNFKLCKPENNE
jgi:hypothetical protein